MPNRLAQEKSPYLLQHKDNPVEWFPWGKEAFELARQRDCPVFLSIGYSTCHWCHVMEQESFCDPEVARLLNQSYVSIKVDREERPDLDYIYMEVCRLLTGRGGWPLSIIMTPEQEPFYAATYISRESRGEEPGMLDLLPRIALLWKKERHVLANIMQELKGALEQGESNFLETRKNIFDRAFHELQSRYDFLYGGFDVEPKFPAAHNLLFLLKYSTRSGNNEALEMAERTLHHMRLGGIFDHVGFGFHRYSTDRQWSVPHFEKMLYDQASLAQAYSEAFHLTGDAFYRRVAREIFTYVEDKLTSPKGAFYCAEDADSEGREGACYLFTNQKLREILTPVEYEFLNRNYAIDSKGNLPSEPGGAPSNENILYINIKTREPSKPEEGGRVGHLIEQPHFQESWAPIRKKLLRERMKREQPFCDDKILTDANGLMIASYARAGFLLESKRYIERAEDAADFILRHMENKGRLFHRYRDDEAAIEGMLDDYIFFSHGLLELYHATGRVDRLRKAIIFMETACDEFFDDREFGFFLTSSRGEPLITRPKNFDDGAVASGNSIALSNLLRLFRITGDSKWNEFAEQLVKAFSPFTSKYPGYYTAFISSLYQRFSESREIVLVYPHSRAGVEKMIQLLRKSSLPEYTLLRKEEGSHELDEIAPFTSEMEPVHHKATAYICQSGCCEMPISDPDEFARWLAV